MDYTFHSCFSQNWKPRMAFHLSIRAPTARSIGFKHLSFPARSISGTWQVQKCTRVWWHPVDQIDSIPTHSTSGVNLRGRKWKPEDGGPLPHAKMCQHVFPNMCVNMSILCGIIWRGRGSNTGCSTGNLTPSSVSEDDGGILELYEILCGRERQRKQVSEWETTGVRKLISRSEENVIWNSIAEAPVYSIMPMTFQRTCCFLQGLNYIKVKQRIL
jgi:hypothetical protein